MLFVSGEYLGQVVPQCEGGWFRSDVIAYRRGGTVWLFWTDTEVIQGEIVCPD